MGLEIRNIERRFDGVAAVASVSLDVAAGEIVALVGPSGCGKTTLLRLAAGLERPEAGEILLDGARLSGAGVFVPPERRPMGFVFQDYVLFPHMTAAENVMFGLGRVASDERRARASAELKAAGLTGLDDRYPHQLSGGQQQRVALARALVRRPKAMLLDEPFASIDAVLRGKLGDDVRRLLKTSKAATLLVTHDPAEALALGDRVAVMKAGRIVEAAAPEALYRHPEAPEGASLFAGAQRIDAMATGGRIDTAFGSVPSTVIDGTVTVVILEGGLRFQPDASGGARIVDCRFLGPDWRIDAAAGDLTLHGRSSDPIGVGAAARALLNPSFIRVFPSQI
jgi:iron(III) transport system ATP-binding protein